MIRPADANEVAEAWRVALDRTHQPVALVLTRQNVPILDRSRYASAEGLRRGGYVLADAEGGEPEVILIATGSEVALARRRPRGAERRRDRLARRQPALLGAVRPPGRGLPRRGAAAGGHRPGLGRGGLDARLGPLRRLRRADDRHAHLRRLGAAEGRAGQVRLHARQGRRGGQRRLHRIEETRHAAAARPGPEPLARQHHPRRCSATARSPATSTSSRSPG